MPFHLISQVLSANKQLDRAMFKLPLGKSQEEKKREIENEHMLVQRHGV